MDDLDDPLAWVQARAEADPVRRRVLEALARRACAQAAGPLRERLVTRLMQRAAAEPVPLPVRRAANAASPLTALVAELQAGPELRQVQAHRHTWSALRLTRRLAEVSAPVPEHLGPLNSQVLVARALQQLQGLSPDYLQRLLTQMDALAALAPLRVATDTEKPARPAARLAVALVRRHIRAGQKKGPGIPGLAKLSARSGREPYLVSASLVSLTPFLPASSPTRCSLVRAYSAPIFTSCQMKYSMPGLASTSTLSVFSAWDSTVCLPGATSL